MWREFADAFVGADQVILTDVCGFHEQPIPGVTGHLLVQRGARRAPRPARRVLPAPRRARRARPRLRAPGRPRPDPRRRRHHHAGRRAARPGAPAGAGVTVTDARPARRRARGRARARAARAGRARRAARPALTTYRVGGPAAVLVRAGREGDLARRGRRRCAATGRRCSILGRGSNLLVADAGFPGLVAAARRRVRGDHARATALGAAPVARSRCRCSPAQAAAAGRAGLGVLRRHPRHGRRRGAHERGWSRPRDPRGAAIGAGSSTCSATGPAVDRSVDDLALGYRTSALGPNDVVARRDLRGRTPTTPAACEAAHRRDRALAPGAPARRRQRRVGVPQPAGRRAPAA